METVIYHYNSMIIICRYSTTQYSPLPTMCNIHTIARLLAMQNIHYHIFAGITGMAEDYFVLVREGVKNTHGGMAQS